MLHVGTKSSQNSTFDARKIPVALKLRGLVGTYSIFLIIPFQMYLVAKYNIIFMYKILTRIIIYYT